MNSAVKILIGAAFLALATTGCYTKLYRPGMEQAGTGPYGQIYNRYDSTAIDTTLTKEDYQGYDTYPSYYDNWSYWGRPRGRTLWGFDFNNFSPDYYWSYYGYYDYYGRPWWDSWYDRGSWGYPNYGSGEPAEPPSRQPGDRGRDSGGSYATPPAVQGGGTYVPPTTDPAPQPQPQPPKQGTSPNQKPQPSGSDSNQGSSGSGRGR